MSPKSKKNQTARILEQSVHSGIKDRTASCHVALYFVWTAITVHMKILFIFFSNNRLPCSGHHRATQCRFPPRRPPPFLHAFIRRRSASISTADHRPCHLIHALSSSFPSCHPPVAALFPSSPSSLAPPHTTAGVLPFSVLLQCRFPALPLFKHHRLPPSSSPMHTTGSPPSPSQSTSPASPPLFLLSAASPADISPPSPQPCCLQVFHFLALRVPIRPNENAGSVILGFPSEEKQGEDFQDFDGEQGSPGEEEEEADTK